MSIIKIIAVGAVAMVAIVGQGGAVCVDDTDPCPGYTPHLNGYGCDTQGDWWWPFCCSYDEYYKNCPGGQVVYRLRTPMDHPSQCDNSSGAYDCIGIAPPEGGGGGGQG